MLGQDGDLHERLKPFVPHKLAVVPHKLAGTAYEVYSILLNEFHLAGK